MTSKDARREAMRSSLARQKSERPNPAGITESLARPSGPVHRMQINLPADMHTSLKIKAAQEGTNVTKLVIDAIRQAYNL